MRGAGDLRSRPDSTDRRWTERGWPDRRVLDLLGLEIPIIQAPMAGFVTPALLSAVREAGALASLPLGMADLHSAQATLEALGSQCRRVNLNFFCHPPAREDAVRERVWEQTLKACFADAADDAQPLPRHPSAFGEWQCELIERIGPKAVSFHFGLPGPALLQRVKATGAKVLCSATSVREARALEEAGCDAIIAQGIEAGGHRGSFLDVEVATQLGTLTLVPQIVDAVKVPVIAAGGIGDGRGVAAALALGAAAVQLGTAYLFCPEARVSATFRKGLHAVAADGTAITNSLSGRPARVLCNRLVRELGFLVSNVPAFPLPAYMLRRFTENADRNGRSDWLPVWCGQGAPLGKTEAAAALTRRLAAEAREILHASSRLTRIDSQPRNPARLGNSSSTGSSTG